MRLWRLAGWSSGRGGGLSPLEGLQLQFVPVRSLRAAVPRRLVVVAVGHGQLLVLLHCLQAPDALDGSKARVDKPAPMENKPLNRIVYVSVSAPVTLAVTHGSYLQLGVKEWLAL